MELDVEAEGLPPENGTFHHGGSGMMADVDDGAAHLSGLGAWLPAGPQCLQECYERAPGLLRLVISHRKGVLSSSVPEGPWLKASN